MSNDLLANKLKMASEYGKPASFKGGLSHFPWSGKLPFRRRFAKVGRNDPCPCGSGKKFKKCHLKTAGNDNE